MATHPLRRERELRGWSQSHVAEAVGVSSRTVSRWEQGITLPYPQYREHLCRLFDKSAKELGVWMQEEEGDEGPVQVPDVSVFSSPVRSLFFDPMQPSDTVKSLFGREDLLQMVKQRMLSSEQPMAIALHGLPGVGKTALVLALATDTQVRSFFSDGILWASLGPQPDLLAILKRWGYLLGLEQEIKEVVEKPAEWAMALRTAIGSRRFLLVLDDVWSAADAFALQVGGVQCTYVLTTRLPQVAFLFAPDGVISVPELEDTAALAMLTYFVPALDESQSEGRSLVQSVGGLPLALKLLGIYLGAQAISGQPRRLRNALMLLQHAEQRLHIRLPMTWDEYAVAQRHEVSLSLYSAIAMSERQLGKKARVALKALAVFPAKPNSFSEEAALTVSQVTGETLDELWDVGLLESHSPGRYCLHQTIADYAHGLPGDDSEVQTRLIDWMCDYIDCYQHDHERLACEIGNLLAALQVAVERKLKSLVLENLQALQPFLRTFRKCPQHVVMQLNRLMKHVREPVV